MTERNQLIQIFSEGIYMEELPTIFNLKKLKGLIDKTNIDSEIKQKLLKIIQELIDDSLVHSKVFSTLLDEVN